LDAWKKHIVIPFLFCSLAAGCTFHSNQLEILKTIFGEDEGPQPQWVFSWGEITEEVFAINAGSKIFFANANGLLVLFNGTFVEKIEGLRVNSQKPIDISISKTELGGLEIFRYRGRLVDFGELSCELPSESVSETARKNGNMQTIRIRQACSIDDNETYQTLVLNQSRQLVALQFVVHPAHPVATIRYNQI
jgi:hypothetical protein